MDDLDLSRWETVFLWRLKYRVSADDSGWLYVFLILEPPTEPDRSMVVRMVAFKALLYDELIRRRDQTWNGLLPPILTVVPWVERQAGEEETPLPSQVALFPGFAPTELSRSPSPFGFPRWIDDMPYVQEEGEPSSTEYSVLFQLEQSRTRRDVEQRLEAMRELLTKELGPPTLREASAVWLASVLRPLVPPGVEFSEVRDLKDAKAMLEHAVLEWRDSWIEEGRQKGLQEGEARMLLRQLQKKFGSISSEIEGRVTTASTEQLFEWADRVLEAETLDQVFGS